MITIHIIATGGFDVCPEDVCPEDVCSEDVCPESAHYICSGEFK